LIKTREKIAAMEAKIAELEAIFATNTKPE